MKVFYLAKDITLTTDTSEHSVLGIRSQGHPKMYLPRMLGKAELNYLNTE